MKTKFTTQWSVAATALTLLVIPASAVDLLARYPTQLTKGDAEPDHARPWDFTQDDIFRVSTFELQVADKLKVKVDSADLGIGHCSDGAVWAVLLPRGEGTLTSSAADRSESIANVWLRFHPSQINQLFPPETVSTDGDTSRISQIRSVADAKFHSSWHAGNNAMIPEPKDVTVYVDTKDGARRFFMVDTEAKTAEYVAAFNQRSAAANITATSVPPVVVKTVPESGSTNVPPGEFEIQVTFSKEMMDGSWSWCSVWDNSCPEGTESPRYDADHKTCAMKVKLEPGKTYGFWLNTERFRNFKDTQGRSAVPYLLVFSTSDRVHAAQKTGVRMAVVSNITPLYTIVSFESMATNDVSTNYTIKIEHQAASTPRKRRPARYYVPSNEKSSPIGAVALREVNGPANNPEGLVLKLADMDEPVKVATGKPYTRVDGYAADFKYPPENKVFKGRREGDRVSFGGENYTVVEIKSDEVILQDQSNQKITSLRLESAQESL